MTSTIIMYCLVFVALVSTYINQRRITGIVGDGGLSPGAIGMIKQELLVGDRWHRDMNKRLMKLETLDKKLKKLQKESKDFEERLTAWDKRRDEKIKNSLSSFNHLYTKLHVVAKDVTEVKAWVKDELSVKFTVRDDQIRELQQNRKKNE